MAKLNSETKKPRMCEALYKWCLDPAKKCQEQFLTSERWPEGENTKMYFIIERSSMPNNG
ncbi:hypothetical protein DK924_12230 [Pseudoalteromonas sp. meg-B1]|nr:hypothetical protein DK924_12230 [Pseudoalteromonas sp. meg-B1]